MRLYQRWTHSPNRHKPTGIVYCETCLSQSEPGCPTTGKVSRGYVVKLSPSAARDRHCFVCKETP